MIDNKIVGQELKALARKTSRIKTKVTRILEDEFDITLHNPKKNDQYRLLRLGIWARRYKVSLKYILKVILPYWRKRLGTQDSSYLGVKITSLCGDFSEELLRQQLEKDFPDQDNVTEWRMKKKWRELAKETGEDEGQVRYKKLLDYRTVDEYVNAYTKRITAKQVQMSRAESDRKRREKRYRDNPWIKTRKVNHALYSIRSN